MCGTLSRVVASAASISMTQHHGRVMVWVQITVTNHESEALPWSRIVRAVLELPWLEVTVICKFVTVICTPPWPCFEEPTQKRCRYRHFFRGGSFVVFGGEKGERKEGRKFVEQSAKLISLILHLRSCRMQIIVATLLLYYYYIISLKYSCLATSFAFEQESRMLVFWMHPWV